MLTKGPEMLQPDTFCDHTMQQNATAAGAPPQTPLGSLQRSPGPLAGFKGAASRRGGGREGRGREGKGKGGDGQRGRGRGGEERLTLMCIVQLEQSR